MQMTTRVTEPQCAKCGYLVHGLESNRCPECGIDLNIGNVRMPRNREPLGTFSRVIVWTLAPVIVWWALSFPLDQRIRVALDSVLPVSYQRVDLYVLRRGDGGPLETLIGHGLIAVPINVSDVDEPPRVIAIIDSWSRAPLIDKRSMWIDTATARFQWHGPFQLIDLARASIDPSETKDLTDETLITWIKAGGSMGSGRDEMLLRDTRNILSELRSRGPWPNLGDPNTQHATPPAAYRFQSLTSSHQLVTANVVVRLGLLLFWIAGVAILWCVSHRWRARRPHRTVGAKKVSPACETAG